MRLFVFLFTAFVSLSAWSLSLRAADRSGELSYDLGASTGRRNGATYTEANLGLNYFAADWLSWRNAIFARFQESIDTAYGLDTSLRLNVTAGAGAGGVSGFIGPGWRFANGLSSAPLAEAGLVLHLGRLSIGGGAKFIANSAVNKGEPDDLQYFVVLGGGGRLL